MFSCLPYKEQTLAGVYSGFLFRSQPEWLEKEKKVKNFQVSKIIELSTNFVSPVETFTTILGSYPWKFKFCSNFKNC
jgi:hypothetical protein